MLLLTFKIPRSKRWLLMKGYHEEAKESMQFVYKGNIEDEFDRMAETIGSLCCRKDDAVYDDVSDEISMSSSIYRKQEDIPTSETDLSEETESKPSLWDKKYKTVMMIGVGLLASQQFSGQPSVLAYSRVLFEAAGWKGHASVVTVTIMGITSTITVALVDRLGRKILLSAGCIIMSLALLVLAYGFWGWDDDKAIELGLLKQYLILGSMFIYIAGYQVGYGPITWTVLSEIYPSEIRGTAMAFSVEVNFLSMFLCQLFFTIIQDVLGWGFTFILFTCIVVSSLIFINIMVPETKGMSLEEIQIQLKGLSEMKTRERPAEVRRANTTGSNDSSSPKRMKRPLLADQPPPPTLTPIV